MSIQHSTYFKKFSTDSKFQNAIRTLHAQADSLPIPVRNPTKRLLQAIDQDEAAAAAWQLKDAGECLFRFLFIVTAAEVLRLDADCGSRWFGQDGAGLENIPLPIRELAEFIRCDERPTMGAVRKRIEILILDQSETTAEGSLTRALKQLWMAPKPALKGLSQQLLDFRNQFFGHSLLGDSARAAQEVKRILPCYADMLERLSDWLSKARLAQENELGKCGEAPSASQPVRLNPQCDDSLSLSPLFHFLPESRKGTGRPVLQFLEKGRLLKNQLGYRDPHSAKADWYFRSSISEDVELTAIEAMLRPPETRGNAGVTPDGEQKTGWLHHLQTIRWADYQTNSDDFIKPAYLWDQLEAVMNQHASGYLRLQGPGGCGKSFALKGWMDHLDSTNTAERYCLCLLFFASSGRAAGHREMVDTLNEVLRSKVRAMHDNYTLFGNAPSTTDREKAITTPEGFADYLEELVAGNRCCERIILIIDGIDEIRLESDQLNILELLPDEPPDGLLILLSGRGEDELHPKAREHLARLPWMTPQPIRIETDPQKPGGEANQLLLQRFLQAQQVPQEEHPKFLEASGGRFLYLRTLLRGITIGAFSIDELPTMEAALGLYLDALCQGLQGVPGYGENLTKTIALLAVAEAAVPMECLLDWGIDERFLDEILLDLRHFLSRMHESDFDLIRGQFESYNYTLFHKELRSYLEASAHWQERLQAARATLAEKIWEDRSGLYGTDAIDHHHPADAYALLWGSSHLPATTSETLCGDLTAAADHVNHLAKMAYERKYFAECILLNDAIIAHMYALRGLLIPLGCWTYSLQNALAAAFVNRGTARSEIDQQKEAIDDYSQSVKIRDAIRKELQPLKQWTHCLKSDQAVSFMNRGNAKNALGKHKEALDDYNRAITYMDEIRLELQPLGQWKHSLQIDLSLAMMNRGDCQTNLGNFLEAVADCSLSILFMRNLRKDLQPLGQWTITLQNYLAGSLTNRANACTRLGQDKDALDDYNEGIKCMDETRMELQQLGQWTRLLQNNIAKALLNRGCVLRYLDRPEEALQDHSLAIKYFKDITQELQPTSRWSNSLRKDLATALINRGNTNRVLIRFNDAAEDYSEAIDIMECCRANLQPRGNWNQVYHSTLTNAYTLAYIACEQIHGATSDTAQTLFLKAINTLEPFMHPPRASLWIYLHAALWSYEKLESRWQRYKRLLHSGHEKIQNGELPLSDLLWFMDEAILITQNFLFHELRGENLGEVCHCAWVIGASQFNSIDKNVYIQLRQRDLNILRQAFSEFPEDEKRALAGALQPLITQATKWEPQYADALRQISKSTDKSS